MYLFYSIKLMLSLHTLKFMLPILLRSFSKLTETSFLLKPMMHSEYYPPLFHIIYKFIPIFVQFKWFLPNLGFLLPCYFDHNPIFASCFTHNGRLCKLVCLAVRFDIG